MTGANAVLVIDAIRQVVTNTIPILGNPTGIAITPDGKSAYIPNGPQILVLDTDPDSPTFQTFVDTITVGAGLVTNVAISPEGTFAYVVDEGEGTVLKIRTRTRQIEARISVGPNRPAGIGITRGGGRIFVVNHDADSVSVIERGTNTVTTTIQVGRAPLGVAAR